MLTVIIAGFPMHDRARSSACHSAERADIYLPLLAVFTIFVGSRVTIPIPRFKSHIAVSDTFIFLTLLIYGGELRDYSLGCQRRSFRHGDFVIERVTVFFNAAAVAISTVS